MAQKLTDLSQLKVSMVKTVPENTDKKPAAKPSSPSDGQYAIDYFKRPEAAPKDENGVEAAAATGGVSPKQLELLQGEVKSLRKKLKEAEDATAKAENKLRLERDEHSKTREELENQKKEVQRRDNQLRTLNEKLENADKIPAAVAAAPVVVDGLLVFPPGFEEVFTGEVREHLLTAMREALDHAKNSGRDRRKAILSAVLGANPSADELKQRREELERILKEAGSFRDNSTLDKLERLGFKFVSGKKHWKMQYAGMPLTISKTPSDFRALKNSVQEISNRCF